MSEHSLILLFTASCATILAVLIIYCVVDGRRGSRNLGERFLLFGDLVRQDQAAAQRILEKMDARQAQERRANRLNFAVIRRQNLRMQEIARESKAMARDSEIMLRMILERTEKPGGQAKQT